MRNFISNRAQAIRQLQAIHQSHRPAEVQDILGRNVHILLDLQQYHELVELVKRHPPPDLWATALLDRLSSTLSAPSAEEENLMTKRLTLWENVGHWNQTMRKALDQVTSSQAISPTGRTSWSETNIAVLAINSASEQLFRDWHQLARLQENERAWGDIKELLHILAREGHRWTSAVSADALCTLWGWWANNNNAASIGILGIPTSCFWPDPVSPRHAIAYHCCWYEPVCESALLSLLAGQHLNYLAQHDEECRKLLPSELWTLISSYFRN